MPGKLVCSLFRSSPALVLSCAKLLGTIAARDKASSGVGLNPLNRIETCALRLP